MDLGYSTGPYHFFLLLYWDWGRVSPWGHLAGKKVALSLPHWKFSGVPQSLHPCLHLKQRKHCVDLFLAVNGPAAIAGGLGLVLSHGGWEFWELFSSFVKVCALAPLLWVLPWPRDCLSFPWIIDHRVIICLLRPSISSPWLVFNPPDLLITVFVSITPVSAFWAVTNTCL